MFITAIQVVITTDIAVVHVLLELWKISFITLYVRLQCMWLMLIMNAEVLLAFKFSITKRGKGQTLLSPLPSSYLTSTWHRNYLEENSKKMCISTPTTLYRLRRLCIHTHTHIHTHEYACSQTNTIQTDVAKDSITQSKCSEKRNVLSLFLKEGRVVECLTSWGRLFQMSGLI